MSCVFSCRICCGKGGSIALLALVAWLGITAARSLSFVGSRLAHLDVVLVPAMAVALGVVTTGLWLGAKSHGRADPLMVGIAGSLATVLGTLFWLPAALLGAIGVAGAVVANQWFLRRQAHLPTLP